MNGTLNFSLLFMVAVKGKLVITKLTVSVKSSTPSLNFMATTGIVTQTSFPMKTLFTRLSKTKMETPCQSKIFVPEIISKYKIYKTTVTMLKSSGKKIGKLS